MLRDRYVGCTMIQMFGGRERERERKRGGGRLSKGASKNLSGTKVLPIEFTTARAQALKSNLSRSLLNRTCSINLPSRNRRKSSGKKGKAGHKTLSPTNTNTNINILQECIRRIVVLHAADCLRLRKKRLAKQHKILCTCTITCA